MYGVSQQTGANQPSRHQRSFSGMVGAMLVTLLVVLAFVGWRSWRRRRPEEKPWTVADRGPLEPRDDVTTVSDAAPAMP